MNTTSLSPKKRALKILGILQKIRPDAKCELTHSNPLELLVAVILSAQCTDKRVNIVTPALFKKYRTAKDYGAAPLKTLEELIRSTGFYRNKAKSIQRCCAQIAAEHGGKVPETMEELVKLAGVGRKTANVIRAYAFGKPGMIVDTHVLRVASRLGFSKQKDAVKMERELCALVPEKEWEPFCTHILLHGRYCCKARKPNCPSCPISHLCPSRGFF